MADHEFDSALERMFSQAPAFADSDEFARKVGARLNRTWRWRTLGIGMAGAVGGLIAVSQVLQSNITLRLTEASTVSTKVVETAYREAAVGAYDLRDLLPAAADAGLFWIVSAVMVVVAIVGATRVIDEI